MRFWAYLRSFLGHPPGDSTGCFRIRLCLLFLSFSSLNCSWLSIIHFFTSDLLARKRVCSPLDLTPRPWILSGFGALLERFWRGFGALLEVIHAFWSVFGDFERFWVVFESFWVFLELLDPCETAWIPLWGPFVGLPRKLEVFLCLWLGSGSLFLPFECFLCPFCWFRLFCVFSVFFVYVPGCFSRFPCSFPVFCSRSQSFMIKRNKNYEASPLCLSDEDNLEPVTILEDKDFACRKGSTVWWKVRWERLLIGFPLADPGLWMKWQRHHRCCFMLYQGISLFPLILRALFLFTRPGKLLS